MDSGFDDRVGLLRLRRIEQLNERLRQQLKKDRIPASRAARLLIEQSEETKDPLIPYLWREAADDNKFKCFEQLRTRGPNGGGGLCCAIV